jgi:hypothetical protein
MIRHAEKPPKGPDGEDPPGLSTEGVTRAEGLVQTFGKDSNYSIGFIIAEHPKKSISPSSLSDLLHFKFVYGSFCTRKS